MRFWSNRSQSRQLRRRFGASYLARIVGQKKAREIWFLCRRTAAQALEMGLVNVSCPWMSWNRKVFSGRTNFRQSPIAIRCLKAAFNADCDGQAGLQELAGNATLLYYMTEEGLKANRRFWKSVNNFP